MLLKVIRSIGSWDYGHVYRASHRDLVNRRILNFCSWGEPEILHADRVSPEWLWYKSDVTQNKKLSLSPCVWNGSCLPCRAL